MTARLICGDALAVLRTLDTGSVQTCITSPPYYALRSYLPDGHPDKPSEIGLESTLDGYLAALVWARVYMAAHYARRYLGETLTRAETEARLDELLQLERRVVLGVAS